MEMLYNAVPMIEAMLHEFHDQKEAARRRPYLPSDLWPSRGDADRVDAPGALIDRAVAGVAGLVRTRVLRSRPAATSC